MTLSQELPQELEAYHVYLSPQQRREGRAIIIPTYRGGNKIWETGIKVTQHIKAPNEGKTPWLDHRCSEAIDSEIYTTTKLDSFPGAWIPFKIKLLATENSGVYRQRID